MAKKISNQLVLLSSAAIVSIYGVGFLHTEAAADKLGMANTAATTTTSSTSDAAVSTALTTSAVLPPGLAPRQQPAGGRGDQGERRRNRDGRPPLAGGYPGGGIAGSGAASPSGRSTATSTASTATTSTAAASGAAATSPYRDGTYSGSAENRHGDLTVTVVVQGGRIASADITNCGMQYPCSRIADLPGEAVQRQSVNVDQVTGATYSWMAYRDALTQALAQAQGNA